MCIFCRFEEVLNLKPEKLFKKELVGQADPELVANLNKVINQIQTLQYSYQVDTWLYKEKGMTAETIKKVLTEEYKPKYEVLAIEMRGCQRAILSGVGLDLHSLEGTDVQYGIDTTTLQIHRRYFVDAVPTSPWGA